MSALDRLDLSRCVKVCGLTRAVDVALAIEAGADLFGFVAAPAPGPRALAPQRLLELVAAAPTGRAVLVVVGGDARAAIALALAVGAGLLQVCGPAAAADFAAAPLPLLRALPVGADTSQPADLVAWEQVAQGFVFEPPGALGGSGRCAPTEAVRALSAGRRGLLAGGLDAANVAARLAATGHLGADASSRLECAPGIKDADRVRGFVAAARAAFALRAGSSTQREVDLCS
jgi:phosphoribosylanthranilate isomerase